MIIGSSGSGKTNTLLNLIKDQDYTDKIYLCVKDLSEPKYHFLIKKCEDARTKLLNDPNALLKVEIWWMVFMRILIITIQAKKEKF